MGPQTQSVERRSQATPFAENFLAELNGILNQSQGSQTVGPMQFGAVGNGPSQTLASRVGGVNTAGQVSDYSSQLLSALQNRSRATTEQNAAQLRESMGAAGNRFSVGTARGEGQLRSEAGLNLDQLVAQVLTDQGQRQQEARQFDTLANQQVLQLFSQMAGMGILPEELLVSPGIGSQILTGALGAAGAAFGAPGGLQAIMGMFGRGGNNAGFVPGPPQMQLPTNWGNI